MKNNQTMGRECSCAAFERLEGASVPAYIKAFLEQDDKGKSFYRCRVCAALWERRSLENENESVRPSLVRLR